MVEGFPNGLSQFHKAIYKLVEDASSDRIISWGKSNNSLVIWNQEELIRSKLLLRFTCCTMLEFISELRYYGFRRIKKGSSGELEFGNEDFVRGHPERLRDMMLKAWRKKKAKLRAKKAAKFVSMFHQHLLALTTKDLINANDLVDSGEDSKTLEDSSDVLDLPDEDFPQEFCS